MNVIRNHTNLKMMTREDDSFVAASPKELVAFMWELTAELWSLRKKGYAERRLQRNITRLIENKESTGREKDKLDAKYLRQIKK